MNVLLDLVVCGPGARMCGGFSQLLRSSGDNNKEKHHNLLDDPEFWDTLSGRPPLPKVIEISEASDESDSVSLLSEVEITKAYNRYREVMARKEIEDHEAAALSAQRQLLKQQKEQQHDLHFEEAIVPSKSLMTSITAVGVAAGESDYEGFDGASSSLDCSSFDSRMGDTRYMEMEKPEDDGDGGGCDESKFDDGSSYSSFYFRLRPSPRAPASPAHTAPVVGVESCQTMSSTTRATRDASWQTTSTRTTQDMRNPSRFSKYE